MALSTMLPPSGVNFTAFPSRFVTTCPIRRWSALTSGIFCGNSKVKVCPLLLARGSNCNAKSLRRLVILTGAISRVKAPARNLPSSNRFDRRDSKLSAPRMMLRINLSWELPGSGWNCSLSSWADARTGVSGVLSSCARVAINRSLVLVCSSSSCRRRLSSRTCS